MSRGGALRLELRWTLNALLRRRRAGLSDFVRAAYLIALIPIELIGSLVTERKAPRDPKRILVIKTDQLGDVLFATLLNEPLKKAYPDARIDWLVQDKARPVLEGNPDIGEVIVWHELAFALLPGRLGASWSAIPRMIGENARTLRMLRRRGYDLAINARMRPPSGNPIWSLIGAPLAGWNGVDWGFLARVPAGSDLLRPRAMFTNLLHAVDAAADASALHPRFYNIDRSRAAEFAGTRYAVLSPATYDTDRSWGTKKWHALAQTLVGEGFLALVVGTPEQRKLLEEIASDTDPQRVRVILDADIPAYAGLLETAACFAGIESFPAHLAMALDVPGVCFINTGRYYVHGMSDAESAMSATIVPDGLSLTPLPLTSTPEEVREALRPRD